MSTSKGQSVPINIVGSSIFGVYPKTNIEKTLNMFMLDGWLCNYAGFKKILSTGSGRTGRGLFVSSRGGFMIQVTGSSVYKITKGLGAQLIGVLETSSGGVSIAENLSRQICIADGLKAYIYNYSNGVFTKQSLNHNGVTVLPNYVDSHNGFFLIGTNPLSESPNTDPQYWYAATFLDANNIQIPLQNQFSISTKPDNALAVVRLPGRGNNVVVIGSIVAEFWTQVADNLAYRRISSSNLNVGCISVETIAASDDLVVWLAQNEDEAPVVVTTDGSSNRIISTDGISHLLESLNRPDKSTGFIYKQNGHLFYHLTFYDEDDNLSLLYDFNTDKFYNLSDEDQNYHPARKSAFFNKKVYFTSLNDNGLYEMSQDLVTYKYTTDATDNGEVIPRIRVTNTVRRDDSSIFRANTFTFWLEQGVTSFFVDGSDTIFGNLITETVGDFIVTEDGLNIISEDGATFANPDRPRVDMTMSKNGNQSFGRTVSREMNPQGVYRNQINWHRLGQANELTLQLRFWGFQRFIANNGVLEIY